MEQLNLSAYDSQGNFVGFEFVADAGNFGEHRGGILAFALELANLLGQGIATGLEILGTGLARLALVLEGLEGGGIKAHAAGSETLRNKIQSGTKQLNIKHDNPYSNRKTGVSIAPRPGSCFSRTRLSVILHRNMQQSACIAEIMNFRKFIAHKSQNFS